MQNTVYYKKSSLLRIIERDKKLFIIFVQSTV